MTTIVPALDHHVDEILQRGLRAADVQEFLDLSGEPPEVELRQSVANSSRAWAWLQDDGSVFAIFGVAPVRDVEGCGMPWLMATDDAKHHRKDFVRLVHPYVEEMSTGYKFLTNFVSEDHAESIRWLQCAGFNFIKRYSEFGVSRKPFLQFYKAT